MPAVIRTDLRYGRLWFAFGVVLLMILLALALIPLEFPPSGISNSDKVGHALAFAGLMIVFCGIVTEARWPAVFAALFAYGILIEILQMPMPTRFAELADVIANTVGLLAGVLLARLWLANWCRNLERKLGL